jgi:hypothetical protein
MDLHPDFKDLLSAFADTRAEYLIVGGWAVGYHGEPRFTKDLDVLIGHPRTVDWGGVQVSIIGLDDLVAAKKAAGRARDRRDLKVLETVRRKKKRGRPK